MDRKEVIWFLVAAVLTTILLVISGKSEAACRSQKVKHQFDKHSGYPNGRPGYIVDHICALGVGGLDIESNMQYQTYKDSKEKDKVENTLLGRKLYCNAENSLPYRTVFNCK